MFCIICKKHGVVIPQNITEKFTLEAFDRFKSDAIETRKNECFRSEDDFKNVCFPQRVVGEKETKVSVSWKTFSTAYFLMKEFLPNFLSINTFHDKCNGCDRDQVFSAQIRKVCD